MERSYTSPIERRAAAAQSLTALGRTRRHHVLLRVRCPRSHHVATVYDTEAGPVFVTQLGPHAHGSRDFVDVAHHARRSGAAYIDLLDGDPHSEDALPARCECGATTLSRTTLKQSIATYERTVRIR